MRHGRKTVYVKWCGDIRLVSSRLQVIPSVAVCSFTRFVEIIKVIDSLGASRSVPFWVFGRNGNVVAPEMKLRQRMEAQLQTHGGVCAPGGRPHDQYTFWLVTYGFRETLILVPLEIPPQISCGMHGRTICSHMCRIIQKQLMSPPRRTIARPVNGVECLAALCRPLEITRCPGQDTISGGMQCVWVFSCILYLEWHAVALASVGTSNIFH